MRKQSHLFVFFLLLLAPSYSLTQRKVTEESILFKKLRDGVFTIFSDAGHGSGFLIDSIGLVLTNEHVIAHSTRIRVQLDESTKVVGIVLKTDPRKDVALILINPAITTGRPILNLAPHREQLAMEGERVIAIGSPLNQSRILTSGIVSKVEQEAIISDVNINHGNSGGPLINMDGEVIAINTFGDFTKSGPGISGSIMIWAADEIIDSSRTLSKSIKPPSKDLLPVMPRTIYPLDALEAFTKLKNKDTDSYDVSELVSTGDYRVSIMTPPYLYWRSTQYELEMADKRKERESQGKATADETYSPYDNLKSWFQYVGDYAPVVILSVMPKIGETSGSIWGNALGAAFLGSSYRGTHNYEFKADLKDIVLYRDSIEQAEIIRGLQFVPMSFYYSGSGSDSKGTDLARSGQFTFSPEIFAPTRKGWPSMRLVITSIDKPNDPVRVDIPRRTLEKIWRDFDPYREQKAADDQVLLIEKQTP